MTYEILFSTFIGAALAAIGFVVLGLGLVRGVFMPRKPVQRAPILALTGALLMVTGIWLLRAMS